MADVLIVGKKGSKSKLEIVRNTDLRLLKTGHKADVIVNYGLPGQKLRAYLGRHPTFRNTPIINRYVGVSKYKAVQDAKATGILVPESRVTLPKKAKLSDWIEKRHHSSQGDGICVARRRSKTTGKYYQLMISDRKFELRVHTFLWLPQDEWKLHKRLGPDDQIAWNFHQGGYFQTVRYPNKYPVFLEAKEISKKILEMRRMAFGAVDLIVDNNMKVYFIEVNASPGFTELSQGIYIDAMNKLASMSPQQAKKFGSRDETYIR